MKREYVQHPSYDPDAPLLTVENLQVRFATHQGSFHAVNGIGYTLSAGETFGILGESGSGKSVSQEAVLGIVRCPPGHVSGSVRFRGIELVGAPEPVRRSVRGQGIAMIFQDAVTSLNPGLTVGFQIAEMYRVRMGVDRRSAMRRAAELMDHVRIPSARERIKDYPHQFSGGMSQRVMIAMALAQDPAVLIADEPTTALDVTVQGQILALLRELQIESGLALVLITHDLGVIAEVADRVAVMYAGRIVESAPIESIFRAPSHPYTAALMESMPHLETRQSRLKAITGAPPVLSRIPPGCAFHPRCALAQERCRSIRPQRREVSRDHFSACHYVENLRHLGVPANAG